MPDQTGSLTVTVDSIVVGARHRKDAGDLDALAASIDQLGLLQPITVTPDRVLVCGWRRLQAVKRLGVKSIKVWVRSGISEPAAALLAERDENTQRKDYSPLEKEALYREIKMLLREDAARRQAATRFGATRNNGGNKRAGKRDNNGGVQLTPPEQPDKPKPVGEGKVREQSALIVTGRKSQNTLERISALVDLTKDTTQPEHIRTLATEALARIEDGHPVYPEYETVRTAVAAADPDRQTIEPVTREDLQELVATIKKNENPRHNRAKDTAKSTPDDTSANVRNSGSVVAQPTLRQWAQIWRSLRGWTQQYDPTVIAIAASEADWALFCDVVAETKAFARRAQTARTTKDQTSGAPNDQTLFDATEIPERPQP